LATGKFQSPISMNILFNQYPVIQYQNQIFLFRLFLKNGQSIGKLHLIITFAIPGA